MMAFAAAMSQSGIDPPAELIADGKVRRFDSTGDAANKKNGWYVLFDDPPAGAFGCWRRGIKETWHDSKEVSEQERAEFRQRIDRERMARRLEEEKVKKECREKASKIWAESKPCTGQPYLTRKGISAHGARVYMGSLVLPVRNAKRELQGLQFIDKDGGKKFLTGTAKKGCYFSIGNPRGVVCIAEGFATGASIHECTGHAVAVAFDAGNLLPVGQALRAKLPAETIIVFCADNDASGVGQEKAAAAAKECGGEVVLCPNLGEDFNDMHQKHGKSAVKSLF